MWSVGQRIGDYELLAHLRDGGMASLFLARRLGAAGFTRDVAIKIVHPELASDPQFRAMFVDEALLSARIHHPNVGHVEELGEIGGTHYLVMEFVHGCSLAQLQRALIVRGRRLAPAFAARIAMHVAEGLHAAHETRDETGRRLDVVHRDVSPENILLAYAGHVKLIDFGIAKAYGRKHRTEDGLLKGKFRYMSPEQAHGHAIDRRTDVYQLAIVLWEMLTLRRLFDAGTDVDLIAQVQKPQVAPPSRLVDRIPPALEGVLMAALDPDPARRPADAQRFARQLGKALPSALEVDSGALSGLLLAIMQEQRREQKRTYPSGWYERFEQQIPTQREHGGASDQPKPQPLKRFTYEHTAPRGSDSPGPEAMVRRRGARALQGAPRPRRLVRLAGSLLDTISELGTSITKLTGQARMGGKALALLMTGALCLALVLASATLWLRRPDAASSVSPAMPAPLLRPQASFAKSKALAPDAPLVLTPISTDTDEGAAAALPARDGGVHTAPGRAEPERRARVRLASPVAIDGTPLIPEPGF